MDNRSTTFLEVMIGIAVVAGIAGAIFLVARHLRRRREISLEDALPPDMVRGYGLILAVVPLLAMVAIVAWQLTPAMDLLCRGEDCPDQARSLIFLVVMLALGGLGLLGFLTLCFTRILNRPGRTSVVAESSGGDQRVIEVASGARLVGLLFLALAFLLLNWIYVPREQQYLMMLNLIYPASLAVALVLLFDKATRSWSAKGPGATVREWLFCDGIVFLLFLGYINLLQLEGPESYAALVWDFLFIVLFFVTFWIVDRKVTRYRFLLAYGYLLLVPILLLIWQAVQDVPQAEELSWWLTIWPVFFLVILFFFLEVIALIAARDTDRNLVPTIKDAVFMGLLAILLVVAIPATSG